MARYCNSLVSLGSWVLEFVGFVGQLCILSEKGIEIRWFRWTVVHFEWNRYWNLLVSLNSCAIQTILDWNSLVSFDSCAIQKILDWNSLVSLHRCAIQKILDWQSLVSFDSCAIQKHLDWNSLVSLDSCAIEKRWIAICWFRSIVV